MVLCEIDQPHGMSWSPDDSILFGGFLSGVWRVAGTGGTPELLIPLGDGYFGLYRPQLLPGGEWILFRQDAEQIVIESLATGERRVLIEDGGDVRYLPTGHLAYVRDGALLLVLFDAEHQTITGGAVPMIEGVRASSVNGIAQLAYADDGTLVYQSEGEQSDLRTLVWVDRSGVEEPVGMTPRAYNSQRLSPDGRRVVVDTPDGADELFLYDLETQVEEQFTFHPAVDWFPMWSPDGSQVVFSSMRHGDGPPNLYVKPSDGSGTAERLASSDRLQAPNDWADDGKTLIFSQTDILSLRLGVDAEPETLFGSESAFETVSSLSPNGRWLAYKSDESGQDQIYVRPFPDVSSGGQRLVSEGPGDDALWGPDGRELFYLTPEFAMVVPVDTDGAFRRGTPQPLFSVAPYYEGNMYSWDISSDGQRFLMVKRGETIGGTSVSDDIFVVQNWFQEIRERVPAN